MYKKGTFDLSNKVPCILVKNESVIEVSRQFVEMTQYDADELINKNLKDVLTTLRVGPSFDIKNINEKAEYFLFTKLFEYRSINIEIVNQGNEKIFIMRERPNSRFEVRNSYLYQLCKADAVGIAIYSVPDMVLIKANKKYLDFFQPPFNNRNFSIGMKVEKIIPNYYENSVSKFWKKAIDTGETVQLKENKHIGYEKEITYWDSIITPVLEDGEIKYVVCNTFDVTEKVNDRKKTQEEIKAVNIQNKQLEDVFESVYDGLVLIDNNKKLTTLNKSAEKILNLIERNKKIDSNLNIVKYFDINGNILEEDELPSSRILKGDVLSDYRLIAKSFHREIYISVSGKPVYDNNGILLYGIMSLKDITEKVIQEKIIKLQQDAVLDAERERNETLEKALEMKDEFLSIISHEFRTPLNVINSAIQAMQSICSEDLSESAKKYLRMIKLNTYRQLRLVNNLLDITRASIGVIKINKKNIDIIILTEAIIDSVKKYALQKGIQLIFTTSHKNMIIGIDNEKYERILLNLLSNAIKFTPVSRQVTVRLNVYKSDIHIEIEDKGIGIPKDKIDFIFERFGQIDSSLSRQAEGTGIGLPLVKKLVEALDGKISVKSKLGKGSTFTIILPNKKVLGKHKENSNTDLFNSHLLYSTNVEFSDIYL